MSSVFIRIFKVAHLRKKVFFTIFSLIVYRIGCHITTPGIDSVGLKSLIDSLQGKALGGLISYVDLFVGGALERFTIFGLGIMPYISASIVIQLLTGVVPYFERISKDGAEGRRKIQNIIRYSTVMICVVQATFISRWMASHDGVVASGLIGKPFVFTFVVVMSVTAGTVFLMWLGEQITERGIGNGISLIIFAGIAARIPHEFLRTVESIRQGDFNPVAFLLLLVIFSVVVFFVVYEEQGQRRIPVEFARKSARSQGVAGGSQMSYLPFKINPTGVIPIIFASAIMIIPAQVAQMFGGDWAVLSTLATYLVPGKIVYMVVYAVLVILFSYFYTQVQFNPVDIAENLKHSGGFVPGIRPGTQTEDYLRKVLTHISLGGAFFLAFIAIFPDLLLRFSAFNGVSAGFAYLMGGTSLLILVAVDLDTMKQIEAQLASSRYENLLSRPKM